MANQAAWIKEKQGKPLVVDKAEIPTPEADEVVVKNGALAINPVDWKIQAAGFFIEKFPHVLGSDGAGEITAVGSDVKDFKVGDRVLAHSTGLIGGPRNGAFQLYFATKHTLVAKIPSSMSYTDATVLPLAISTAGAGLYQPDTLALPYPSLSPKPSGKVAIIWGASSSVGSTALQLARASGVETIATASKRNHDYCTKLGASQVFDYNDSSIVDHLAEAVKKTGKEFAGVFDCISEDTTIKASVEVLKKIGASKRLALVLPGADEKAGPDVEANAIFAFSVINGHPNIGKALWGSFVPEALESGALKPLPEPISAGKGLENVQKGMDMNQKGVSAKKVIVEL